MFTIKRLLCTYGIRLNTYSALFYVLCILYTQYQNIIVFNWTVVLLWKNVVPTRFHFVIIVYLISCIPYCKINIKEIKRIAI